jgi:hypothetical protein
LRFVEFLGTLFDTLTSPLSEIEEKLDIADLALRFPMKEARSLSGIIWYLVNKHGGTVHTKGIIRITSTPDFLAVTCMSGRCGWPDFFLKFSVPAAAS